MKILFVIPFYKPAYNYGGLVRSVPALCEGLVQLGCEVVVLTTNASGDSVLDVDPGKVYDINGVKVIYHTNRKSSLLYYSPDLACACHEMASKFDLIYIASIWGYPMFPACRAAMKAKVPFIVTPRAAFMRVTWDGKYFKKIIYHWLFERGLLKRATALHYTSRVEAELSAWLGLKNRTLVVRNPVDLSEFEKLPSRGDFRRRLGIADDDIVVLYLGRVEPRKRVDLTIRAFHRALAKSPVLRLVIAGPEEDGYVASLKSLAANLGISGRISFTGMVAGVERLSAFRDADIFILTSLCENFAVSVVEAMAAGLPVVISDTVGVVDEVTENSAGIAVPLDEKVIASALERLAGSAQLRNDMGNAGREFALRAYLPSAVARDWLKTFCPDGKGPCA